MRQCHQNDLLAFLKLVRSRVPRLLGFVVALVSNYLGLADQVATFFGRGDAARGCPVCGSPARPAPPETLEHLLSCAGVRAAVARRDRLVASWVAWRVRRDVASCFGVFSAACAADLAAWGVASAAERADFAVRCVVYVEKCYVARCEVQPAYSGLSHDASLGPLFGAPFVGARVVHGGYPVAIG